MALPITTASEMGRVDARAIEGYGIPSACLMETAGAKAAEVIWEEFGRPGLRVLVISGKGNNGGDGFVIARHLLNHGAEVVVFTLFPPDEAQGDPAVFLNVLSNMGTQVHSATDEEGLAELVSAAAESDLIVDAILGTGFSPPARGFVAEALSQVMGLTVPIAAVDIPSGLDATSGAASPPFLRTALTITFGAFKRGHFLMPAADHVGKVALVDIGIPDVCIEEEKIPLRLVEASDVADFLPRRKSDANKGDAGHLLIVAGSTGMMGAALMSAQAAAKIGAGKVTLAVPEPLIFAVESGPPEIMALALPATQAGSIDPAAFDLILERSAGMNAILVGPGLSTNPRTVELVHRLIQHIDTPMVLDADGLNALSQAITVLDGPRTDLILTPHAGEMARLVRISTAEVQADRVNLAVEFSSSHRVHMVLKGARSILAMPDGRAWLNPTGNPGLASGGTGDILAGTIGGLLAQGDSLEGALVAGVYLHGLAGDIAAHETGDIGFTAPDLLPLLPKARRRVLESDEQP